MRDPRAGCASAEAVLDPEPHVAREIAAPRAHSLAALELPSASR
jgi:hypothetical protein